MPAPLMKIDLEFPYTRSVGPIIGAYLDGLQGGTVLASRAGGKTLSPPLEHDPATGQSAEPEVVEVGPEGEITSWTWVDEPNPNHPLDRPFAFALIKLDGADTAFVHVVDGQIEGAEISLGHAYGAMAQYFAMAVLCPRRRPGRATPDKGEFGS